MNLALFGDKLLIMTDYKTFYGLSRNPFAALAAGTEVFVAPQVASTMAAMKKALATEDAVVTLSGPVGTGKTTVARRALETVSKFHIILTIGRIQFGHDEVLELLLAGLGVRQMPKSTVHRFATFRRVLQQYAEQQTRVFVLIEDATRVGLDALSELEAVTAADAGVSDGANLILLGDESLPEFLRDSKLARVKQRILARPKISAQTEGELQGYLKHCFRLAGKEFDTIFAAGSCSALHRLSDGIPRVANNLVTATLSAAAEQNLTEIDVALIERIASDEFGLTGGYNVAAVQERIGLDAGAAIDAVPEPEAVPEQEQQLVQEFKPELVAELEPEPEPESEPEATVDPEPVADPEPAPEATFGSAGETNDVADDIPELIQDTLPDLEILAPQLLPEDAEQDDNPVPELAVDAMIDEPANDPTEFELPVLTGVLPEATADNLGSSAPSDKPSAEPILERAKAAVAEQDAMIEPEPEPEMIEPGAAPDPSDNEEMPAWERDPTLAQLRPDLDALERAMAVAHGADQPDAASVLEENFAQQDVAAQPAAVEPAPEAESEEIVPEITLDKQIQAKIEEATEALSQTQIDATAETTNETKGNGADIPVAAAEPLSTAAPNPDNTASLAGTVDAMPAVALSPAEATKADAQLEKIASELARAKTIEDVDDKMAETLFGEEFSMIAAQVAANAPPIGEEADVATGTPAGETMGSVALSLEEDEKEDPAVEVAVAAAEEDGQPESFDTSSSQRLRALRDLNKTAPPPGAPSDPEATETIIMSGGGVELPPSKNSVAVDSIEDQITTSMTQTLKALNVDQMPQNDDDDDETIEKKGFFGLFRRK